jgi:hypothetical protein
MTKRWMAAAAEDSADSKPSAKVIASASVLFIFQLVPIITFGWVIW